MYWIGVDLDGTLAYEAGWRGIEHIGEPIPRMVERVKQLIAEREDVRIFTARASHLQPEAERLLAIRYVQDWCEKHIGKRLPVTSEKDHYMRYFLDDRAISVACNKGIEVSAGKIKPLRVEKQERKNDMDFKLIAITCGMATLPFLQVMPNLEFLQGLEKVGIIGFLSAVVIFLVWERRYYMNKTTNQIATMENRLTGLENNVASGDERIVNLLHAQLETLQEIKIGQNENFSRMWTLAMNNHHKENEVKPNEQSADRNG